MNEEKEYPGSNKGTRLFTQQPQYEIDPQTGLYVVKQWKGAYSMSDESKNEVVNVSPTGKPVLPQWAVVTLTVLTVVAGAVTVIPGLPVAVTAVAGVVAAIGAAFGIASPGLRTQPKA